MENPEPPELSSVQGPMELLACPFCGKAAETLDSPSGHGRELSVFCEDIDDCGAEISVWLGEGATYTMAELIARWNRRAVPSDPSGTDSSSATSVSSPNSSPSPVTGIEEEKWEVIDDGLSGISRMVRINCNGKPIGGWCATGVPGVENLLLEYANAHNASLERILEKTKTK